MNKEEFLNLEIGKTFISGNKVLRVQKEKNLCENCFFSEIIMDCQDFHKKGLLPKCDREKERVVFVEVENESMG